MNWETGPESDQLRPLDHSLAVVNWETGPESDQLRPLDHSLAVVNWETGQDLVNSGHSGLRSLASGSEPGTWRGGPGGLDHSLAVVNWWNWEGFGEFQPFWTP